ncbi:Dachshund 2 [Sesbania bispinosa]|nr:Dachshund 2 [Sesbania bispinosa]
MAFIPTRGVQSSPRNHHSSAPTCAHHCVASKLDMATTLNPHTAIPATSNPPSIVVLLLHHRHHNDANLLVWLRFACLVLHFGCRHHVYSFRAPI